MKAPVALEYIGKYKYNEENDLHPEETDIVTSQEGSSKFRLSVNPSSQLASHPCYFFLVATTDQRINAGRLKHSQVVTVIDLVVLVIARPWGLTNFHGNSGSTISTNRYHG